MANRPARLGIHTASTELGISTFTDMPCGWATYILPNPIDTDEIDNIAGSLVAAGIKILYTVPGLVLANQAKVQALLDALPAQSTPYHFVLGNEISATEPLFTNYFGEIGESIALYRNSRNTILAWNSESQIAPAGMADGMLTAAAAGAANGLNIWNAHIAVPSEFLAVHHHSTLDNLKGWWEMVRKQRKPIHISEGGYPDPQAEGIVGDQDAVDALVEANYENFAMQVMWLPRMAVWYHGTFINNDTGDRYDKRGLYKSDGTANPAKAKFEAVARRLHEPSGPGGRPAWSPRGRSRATVGRRY